MKIILITLALCSTILSTSWAEDFSPTTFPAQGLLGIEAELDSGSINVEAWKNNTIEVQQLPDTAIVCNVIVELRGKNLFIKADRKNNNESEKNRKIGFIIKAPANLLLKVNSSTLYLNLKGMSGNADVFSDTAFIGLHNVFGNVKTKVITGSIVVNEMAGNLDLVATTAFIDLKNISGQLIAKATTCNVSGKASSADLNIESTTGVIDIKGLTGLANIKNSSGNIKLEWATSPLVGEITVKSSSGNIDLMFPATAKFKSNLSKRNEKTENEFEEYDGFSLFVKSNGRITVKKVR